MQVEDVFAAVSRAVESDKEAWGRQREHAQLPHLTLTYAQSIDGSIAAERGWYSCVARLSRVPCSDPGIDWQQGTPTILSGAESMKMTHLLRTLHDGILVGIGTILADNPSLNARLVAGE